MLALKLLLRNWRSGELRLLTFALLIAVSVVSGISIFIDRLEGSLRLQTAELLGADSVVISPMPHPDEWREEADKRGVVHTDFMRLQTMAYKENQTTLVSLQVTSPGYPLRGNLAVADALPAEAGTRIKGVVTAAIPAEGEVWVGSELFVQLDIGLGDVLEVGDAKLTVSKILTDSPEPFTRYPIVMMNRFDLESTGIIMPGSQVTYRWLLASEDEETLTGFKQWLTERLNPQQEISDAHSRSEWLKNTVDRSTQLLSFSAVISVLLAGVAISIATRQFVERHISQVAVKKSFGATSTQIRHLYFGQLMVLGLLASALGLLAGHFMQVFIAEYMAQFVDLSLPAPSVLPYLFSVLSGVGFLLLFALPPLWPLPTIPPLRVLRSDLTTEKVRVWVQVALSLAALFGLIALFSRDVLLTVKVCGALVIVVVLTLVFSRGLLWCSQKWTANARGFWRLGWVNLQRRYQHNTLLIAVFSTTLMALLSLTLMRNAFWKEIQEFAAYEEVNFFILNINKEQKPILEDVLHELGIQYDEVYPSLVGRVTQVNGQAPSAETAELWIYQWDAWITWFKDLPEQQALTSGQWWPDIEESTPGVINVSIREDIFTEGQFALGDVLTFSINGASEQAKITSVRANEQSTGVSMPFVFQPEDMKAYPYIYNMGLNIPPQHKRAIYAFGREHPTILIESLDAWLEKTQRILVQALDGALYVLLITLVCGCLVLFAAVNSSVARRQQESGLLRAFGSSRKLILGSVWVEFVSVGLLSGVIAVVASEVLFHQLQRVMSDLPFILHYQYWLPLTVGGALFVGILGVVACRSTVSTPPGEVLRNAL